MVASTTSAPLAPCSTVRSTLSAVQMVAANRTTDGRKRFILNVRNFSAVALLLYASVASARCRREVPQVIFLITVYTSSLLKLANCIYHAWRYACIIHRFHDNHNNNIQPQALFFLHSSNLLTVARKEVKLGAHVHYFISMTTKTTNSFKTTSSPFKLANCSMHGGETWCACVFPCGPQQQKASGTFLVSMTTIYWLNNIK